ncbi:MAG TPA: hypothetical protein VLC71_03305 [Thermomonas sp.]|nr:hypothetical protein [Thermomonas sp.]
MRLPLASCAAFLVLSLSACTPAQLRLPDDAPANAQSFAVSGHSPRRFNEPVRFGPYSALEMREGWTASWRIPVGNADLERTAKPYAYTLVALGQAPVEVQCRARALAAGTGPEDRRWSVDLTSMAGPLLACGLHLDGHDPLPLEVAREGDRLNGEVALPWGGHYAIRGLQHYANTPIRAGTSIGYAIEDGGATIAVVDLLNGGRVHLDAALGEEQRVYVAAAAAALLLLDPELGE